MFGIVFTVGRSLLDEPASVCPKHAVGDLSLLDRVECSDLRAIYSSIVPALLEDVSGDRASFHPQGFRFHFGEAFDTVRFLMLPFNEDVACAQVRLREIDPFTNLHRLLHRTRINRDADDAITVLSDHIRQRAVAEGIEPVELQLHPKPFGEPLYNLNINAGQFRVCA